MVRSLSISEVAVTRVVTARMVLCTLFSLFVVLLSGLDVAAHPMMTGDYRDPYYDYEPYMPYPGQPIAPLPARNIFDPYRHENEPITDYTFEEVDYMTNHVMFWRMNDREEICASMAIVYGRVSAGCILAPRRVTPQYSVAQANVGFFITVDPGRQDTVPQNPGPSNDGPLVITAPEPVEPAPRPDSSSQNRNPVARPSAYIVVDPVYPPWTSTYAPY